MGVNSNFLPDQLNINFDYKQRKTPHKESLLKGNICCVWVDTHTVWQSQRGLGGNISPAPHPCLAY